MAGQQDTEHKLREGLEQARAEMTSNAGSEGAKSAQTKQESGANAQPGVDDTASRSGDPAVPDRTQG